MFDSHIHTEISSDSDMKITEAIKTMMTMAGREKEASPKRIGPPPKSQPEELGE